MISSTEVGFPLCPIRMRFDISGRTTRHTTRIGEWILEDFQASRIATSRSRCLGGEREKVARLYIAFDCYWKWINCKFDSSILWASLEICVGSEVELAGSMGLKIVQRCKSSVVNCNRWTSWDDRVEAIFVEVICSLENTKLVYR